MTRAVPAPLWLCACVLVVAACTRAELEREHVLREHLGLRRDVRVFEAQVDDHLEGISVHGRVECPEDCRRGFATLDAAILASFARRLDVRGREVRWTRLRSSDAPCRTPELRCVHGRMRGYDGFITLCACGDAPTTVDVSIE